MVTEDHEHTDSEKGKAEELFDSVKKEMGGYLINLFNTLSHPIASFAPKGSGRHLSFPKVCIYAGISVFAGASFLRILLHREGSETKATIISTLVFWAFEAALLYGLCRILRGRASFSDNLSASLQTCGAVYILSSCFSLCLWASMKTLANHNALLFMGNIGMILTATPAAVFYLVDTILLACYLPAALASVHRFGFLRGVLLVPIALIGLAISYSIYSTTSALPIQMTKPPPSSR